MAPMLALSFDVISSVLASWVRLGAGLSCRRPALRRPERLLELYDFEACPYCRLVREALTELDLDAIVYPCPKRGSRFRPRVREGGGKLQFPYLVDPNSGRSMYESADVIAYLYSEYGEAQKTPLHLSFRPYAVAGSMLTSITRLRRGRVARPSVAPAQPLELWSFEASPFCRLVREVLSELELPYVLHNVGRTCSREHVPLALRGPLGIRVEPSTDNRRALAARAGKVQVPYLVDPNTARELFESKDIVSYLEETYGG